MLDIFKKKPRLVGGVIRSPNLPWLRRNTLIQKNRIIDYYREHYKRIATDNLFVRIIHCYALQHQLNDFDYADYVNNQFSVYARNLGISTPYNKGRFQPKGVLLGPETKEVVQHIVDPDEIYFDIESSWEWLAPVRYLYHTRSDTDFPLMNNTTKGRGFGLLTVDVGMLMVKYRHWLTEMKRRYQQPPDVAQFVGTYVMPDVLPSYMDISVFNRLDLQYSNLPLRKYPASHPFYITVYTDHIDQMNKTVIEYDRINLMDVEQLLYNTPLLYKDNALQLVQTPAGITSRNNEWCYLFQILPYLNYVVKHKRTLNASDNYWRQLYSRMRMLRNDNVFAGIGPRDVVDMLNTMLDNMIEAIK